MLCRYGMLDPNNLDLGNLPLTIRAVFIIGPDKKLKLSLNYPASVGRNMDEIVRCVDALQLSAKHSVVSCCFWTKLTCLLLRTTHSVMLFDRSLADRLITASVAPLVAYRQAGLASVGVRCDVRGPYACTSLKPSFHAPVYPSSPVEFSLQKLRELPF